MKSLPDQENVKVSIFAAVLCGEYIILLTFEEVIQNIAKGVL